jgi:hypothetical protein
MGDANKRRDSNALSATICSLTNCRAGCSIWSVELLRREILKLKPDARINAILIDFFLYDLAKEKERDEADVIPHHRTRSIWY